MNKLVLTLALAITLLTATVVVGREQAQSAEWEDSREVITITVQSGDTVDGYWAEYAPDWMSRDEYRYEIKQLNDMDSCVLYIGDTIQIYTQGGK
jgi:hypothetical protein